METLSVKQLTSIIKLMVVTIQKNNPDRCPMSVEFLEWNLNLIFKVEIIVSYIDTIGYTLAFFYEGEWHEIDGIHS